MSQELEQSLIKIIQEFDAKIDNTEAYLKSLKADRSTVQDLLLKQQGFDLPSNIPVRRESERKLRPIDAILSVMKSNRNKPWSPPDLRDELQKMEEQGKLLSEANNLLFVVHSSLKSLLNRGVIKKIEGEGGNPAYVLLEGEVLL